MAQRKNSGRKPSDHMPQRGPSATKRGPGRKHRAGEPGNRLTKARPQRAYVALMAAWAAKRITKARHRDDHGAYTCVGPVYEVYGMNPDEGREHVIGAGKESDGTAFYSARRKWLGGISAQRGY